MSIGIMASNEIHNTLGSSFEFRGYLSKVRFGLPVGIIIFVAVCRLLKLEEIDTSKQLLSKKLFPSK